MNRVEELEIVFQAVNDVLKKQNADGIEMVVSDHVQKPKRHVPSHMVKKSMVSTPTKRTSLAIVYAVLIDGDLA